MKMKLRAWSISHLNNGSQSNRYENVSSIEAAGKWINKRAGIEVDDDSIDCNAFGLEEFDGEEWTEYYDDYGRDINEILEETLK
jgi:hypothetical protein